MITHVSITESYTSIITYFSRFAQKYYKLSGPTIATSER